MPIADDQGEGDKQYGNVLLTKSEASSSSSSLLIVRLLFCVNNTMLKINVIMINTL